MPRPDWRNSWRAQNPRARSLTERTCPGCSTLADRAPVRHPLAAVVIVDACAAATATLPGSPIDPQLPAGPGVAGGAPVPAVTVGPQHVAGAGHQPMRVADRTYRRARQTSADETQFVAVDIAYPGQHPLVQQRLGDRSIWACGQVGRGELWVPVGPQQIGSQVCDRVAVVGAVEDFQHAQVDADRADIAGFQDDPNAVIVAHRPGSHPPAAVHLQMRVDAGRSDANEQMLAPAVHLVDNLTGQVSD